MRYICIYTYTYIYFFPFFVVTGTYLWGTGWNLIAQLKPIPVFKKNFSWYFQIGKLKNRMNQCQNAEERLLIYITIWIIIYIIAQIINL